LAAGGNAFGSANELPSHGLPANNHHVSNSASTTTTAIRIGTGERRRRWNSGPSAGGLMRGSVVAWPHRKQISAFSAISVPQYLQIIRA
jgi:hypothetical protein